MSEYVLSLGSNLHPRKRRVREAIKWLHEKFNILRCSELYETPELHGIGSPYINAVVECRSDAEEMSFSRMLKEYEISAGRDHIARSLGIVPIDIDIVICDRKIIRPRDFQCEFFQIGFSEFASFPIED